MIINFEEETLSKEKVKQMSPLVLAFVGDAVHSLIVRTNFALTHDVKSGGLHILTRGEVSAVAQAKHFEKISDQLSEEELEIFKKGRNTKINSVAKNASVAEYKKATGFECLIGFLYLSGQSQRLKEIIFM